MDKIEDDLKLLLDAKPVPLADAEPDLVRASSNFVPIVKKTVTYIVCGLLFNDCGQILMMQEAKSSCFGTWYLPAGRMEVGEDIQEAVKREVREETGLEFEPHTMLCMEFACGPWYRFTFVGDVSGGVLKDISKKDQESLQANWFSYDDIRSRKIKLRSRDILSLIELGLRLQSRSPEEQHSACLPVEVPHQRLLLRTVMVVKTDSDLKLLVKVNSIPHLPVADIVPEDISIFIPVTSLLRDAFGQHHNLRPKICGLLLVEHCGMPPAENDGLCLTCLFVLDMVDDLQLYNFINKDYQWYSVTDPNLMHQMYRRLTPGLSVPLLDP